MLKLGRDSRRTRIDFAAKARYTGSIWQIQLVAASVIAGLLYV